MKIPPPVGFPLLPVPDETGRLAWPSYEQSVRDGIRIVLSTRPGEQLMRPRFGAGLDRFLSEPDSVATRRSVHDTVAGNLAASEPRITVQTVEVGDVPGRPGFLRIEITYGLTRTGGARRVGLNLRTGG